MSRGSLREALEKREVVIVCGSGGVGKTSVSAALALAAAPERRTIVVTIDPAKRLASALGLEGLEHEESAVELPGGGTLHAAMLDMKTAWDTLVDTHSPSQEVAERIKTNRLYQGLSEQFIGSQGYMAMERLADLYERDDYDLIVIDTPPTRSALDFLDAPKRMTDFIGGSLLRWIARPYAVAGRVGWRAFNMTASPFLKIADRVLGSQVLEDLSSFVVDFQNLYDGFKKRADEVLELMHSESAAFVVVTTLEGPPLGEAGYFIDRLVDEQLHLGGVVANKVLPERFAGPEAGDALSALEGADARLAAEAAEIEEDAAAATLAHAATALTTLSEMAARDRKRLADLGRRARAPVASVPLLTYDVNTLEALEGLAGFMLGED